MENHFSKLMSELDKKILTINSSEEITLEQSEKFKQITLEYYLRLQDFTSTYEFQSEQEEIQYFKYYKPQIVSELIFYYKVSKMLKRIPLSSKKSKKKYINRELKKIESFYDSNIELINYYRSENTHFDTIYFLRKNISTDIIPVSRLLDTDKNHTTNGSYIIARMLTNIKLNQFLEKEIVKLNERKKIVKKSKTPNSEIYWTAPKVALIEMLYALFSEGAINNGEIEIKKMVKEFEIFFNVRLNDPYRSFAEIKQRKKAPAQFIDSLKNRLIELIQKQDEIP
ncbi:MAG: RteC domain-containing protein [Flavobacteriia bacterium]|nr:RteC domain-containing protein [Flavobacteriia bacterium]